jgi:hypothetical protein
VLKCFTETEKVCALEKIDLDGDSARVMSEVKGSPQFLSQRKGRILSNREDE